VTVVGDSHADENHDDREAQRSDGWARNSKLAYVCFGFFGVLLLAQSLTGWRADDADRREHGSSTIGYTRYLTTGHFAEATFENWESEFLQMAAFVLLTTILVQKGSPESRRPGVTELVDADPRDFAAEPDAPWPVKRGGWVLRLYEHSLGLAFILLFLVSWVGHALRLCCLCGRSSRARSGSPDACGLFGIRTVMVRVVSKLAK
jgi:hypothetical protein